MNDEIIEKLKQKMIDFENEDVYIELENAIQYYTTIKSAKIIVSNEKLIISNEKEKDFIIELHYLDDIEINENTVYLDLTNDIRITLDH